MKGEGLPDVLRTAEVDNQAGIGIGIEKRDELGSDLDGEEPRFFRQGAENRPGSPARAGTELHHQAGLGNGSDVDEPPLQEAGAWDDGTDDVGVPDKPPEEGASIVRLKPKPVGIQNVLHDSDCLLLSSTPFNGQVRC